jgi:hypothetical protein
MGGPLGKVAGKVSASPATAADPQRAQSRWLIAVVAGNGPHYVALPADMLVLVPRARSSTRYTVGREIENSSASSAIACCPLWWSWTS